MKKILLLFPLLFTLFFLSSAKEASAQCSGTVNDSYTRFTCDPRCGVTGCNPRCVGSTVSNVQQCHAVTSSGGTGCLYDHVRRNNICVLTATGCTISSSPALPIPDGKVCPSGGGGTTTPPPGSGGCTSGDCFTGIINCGAVGRDPGSGSCSGGICCVPKSGGPAAEDCTVTMNPASRTLNVGQTFAMTISTGGHGEFAGATASTSNSNVATVRVTAAEDDDPPYSYTVTARAAGTSTVGIRVNMSDGHSCTDNSAITVAGAPTPTPPSNPPTVNLKANNSDGPINITPNTAATLSWTTARATTCEGRQSWTGSKATSGSASTGRLAEGSFVYVLFCTGPGGSASDNVRINVTATPPPSCNCTAWVDRNCGGGTCTASQRNQTRTCTPAGCAVTSRCVADASCVSVPTPTPTQPPCTCGNWTSGACGGGSCSSSQRVQTRTCTPANCSTTSQCVADAGCNPPAPPTLTLTASPVSVNSGASSTLRWSSTNTTSCTASASPARSTWTGSKALNGSQSSGALTSSTVFTLRCTGAGGSISRNASVAVGGVPPPPPPNPPTVDLRINNSNGPITINNNTSATLSWTSSNATSCSASANPSISNWSGSKSISGSQSTGNQTASRTYVITCTGAGGSSSDTVTLNVLGAPPPPNVPTVDLRANNSSGSITIPANSSATLSWSSSNATSCAASANPTVSTWNGSKALNGSQSSGTMTATRVYTIRCTGTGGTSSDSVTINVQGAPPPPPPPPPSASCTVSAVPDPISIQVGQTRPVNVNATASNGTISQVRFVSSNTAVVTATSPDSSSPYQSTLTGRGSGSATIRVSGIMGGVEECTDIVTVSAPAASCTITLNPTTMTVPLGTTGQTLRATTVARNGTITQVQFVSQNSSIATASSPDSSTPYTSQIVATGEGTTTVRATAIMNGNPTCTATAQVNVPSPTCTLNLSPDPLQGIIGQDSLMVANTTQANGVIEEVTFTPANASIATATSPDSSAPFTSTIRGQSEGTTTVTAAGIMAGSERCTDTARVNIIPPEPWWQSTGDVFALGNLISPIPPTCVTPGCNPVLVTNDTSGLPGIAIYSGSTADFSSLSTSNGRVSAQNWLSRTQYTGQQYSYSLLRSLAPSDANFVNVGGGVNGSVFNSGGTADGRGYVWYQSSGNLTINNNSTIPAGRKVVVFVAGNVTINGRINLASLNSFFMIVAQGDISVAAGVTNGNNPAIEGVYFTDRRFLTGTVGAGNDDTRLVVRGAVYAQEAQLERDLREGNTNTPAEDFRFAKEVLLNYPQSLSPKRLIWRETLP